MKIHYLEIVSPNMDAICASYEATYNVKFSDADELLGGAKTCVLADGSIVGVRQPLRETEDPVVRPYFLVDDIEKAIDNVKAQGAKIAVPPLEILTKGTFAIYIMGGVEQGFWQL